MKTDKKLIAAERYIICLFFRKSRNNFLTCTCLALLLSVFGRASLQMAGHPVQFLGRVARCGESIGLSCGRFTFVRTDT